MSLTWQQDVTGALIILAFVGVTALFVWQVPGRPALTQSRKLVAVLPVLLALGLVALLHYGCE